MKTFTAKDAKQGFGEVIESAMREPVTITRNGKPTAVMMSLADFKRYEALEDLVWALRAEGVLNRGELLGADETEKFIREVLGNAGA